jgi:hypothetical protein
MITAQVIGKQLVEILFSVMPGETVLGESLPGETHCGVLDFSRDWRRITARTGATGGKRTMGTSCARG